MFAVTALSSPLPVTWTMTPPAAGPVPGDVFTELGRRALKLRMPAKPSGFNKVPGTVLASIEPDAVLPFTVPVHDAVYVALRSSGPVPPIPVRSKEKEKRSPVT